MRNLMHSGYRDAERWWSALVDVAKHMVWIWDEVCSPEMRNLGKKFFHEIAFLMIFEI